MFEWGIYEVEKWCNEAKWFSNQMGRKKGVPHPEKMSGKNLTDATPPGGNPSEATQGATKGPWKAIWWHPWPERSVLTKTLFEYKRL